MNADKKPKRTIADYHKLKRSVAINFYKTQVHKELSPTQEVKEHEPSNVLANFMKGHWILWIISYVKSRFWFKHRFLSYKHSTDKGIYPLRSAATGKVIKIALASDWATDTIQSKHIAQEMGKHQPDYTIHLGDTYFVGETHEIENNFEPGNSFWPYGKVGSFALNGNHEMYSNGYGFFDKLLPWMGLYLPEKIPQKTSYFCLQNEYWQIIALDTGYRSVGIPLLELIFSKADLRPEVINWLQKEVKLQDINKGIILLTHHQYVSTFDKSYPAAAQQLARFSKGKKVIWFWGHEHRFALYGRSEKDKGITAYGRCIGHGGMPVDIVDETRHKMNTTANLVLYDNRPGEDVTIKGTGHNGYVMLEMEGTQLRMEYYDEHDLLISEQWEYDPMQKSIIGKSITQHNHELTTKQELTKAIE